MVFADALAKPAVTFGALPKEIHTLWKSIQRGPGTVPLRHAVRNMIAPKDAVYGHICKVDPNGPLMQRVRESFEIQTIKEINALVGSTTSARKKAQGTD